METEVDSFEQARGRLGADTGPRNHAVQFYHDEEALFDAVGRYLGAGLAAGERVVAIATRPHRLAIAKCMTGRSFDVDRAEAGGRLRFIDARETLSKFMVGSAPDAKLFHETIESLLAGDGAPVRVFGGMADSLCEQGDLQAAILLEQLWNDLAQKRDYLLLCAYSERHFDGESDCSALQSACLAHSHVFPGRRIPPLAGVDAGTPDIGRLRQRPRFSQSESQEGHRLESALHEALQTRERLLRDIEAD